MSKVQILIVLVLLLALIGATGTATAHNPACHRVPAEDVSQGDAREHNPTLGVETPGEFPGGCTKGNAQAYPQN